jgi:hypothetical protein
MPRLIFDASSLIAAAPSEEKDELVVDSALLEQLHQQYLRGDLTLRGLASQLGLTYRELYEVLEDRHLSF